MESKDTEAKMILALQALEKDPKQSVRSIAKVYDIARTTLRDRLNGRSSRRDQGANLRKLANLEE
jgi:DNA-binding Lrp family transcriptional regulator